MWNVDNGGLKAALPQRRDWIYAVAFSPDGRTLASGSSVNADKTVRLWDVNTTQEKYTLKGHKSDIKSVAFSPDGSTLATASWGEIRLWGVADGQERAALKGHKSDIKSVAFSPDGKTLASGSGDGTILLWDMAPYITPAAPADWCSATQTVVVSFQLQKNGKTASICRDDADTLVYSFGVLGGEPEMEYRGPILGEISARATLWGEGVSSLADLVSALGNEDTTWFDPNIDTDAIAKAARSRETNGFYAVQATTGPVGQGVYIFRRGGWEYAIGSTWGRPINVGEDDLEEYSSHEITVLSPNGKTYHLR